MDKGILLPYQKKWIEDSAKVKVIEKSRRIGLTWAEAAEDTLLAASEQGDNVWYIGYNKDMAIEFIQTCAEWAKKWNQVCGAIATEEVIDEDKKILAYSLTFASGYRITALSSRPSNLRGKQGKVVIDEAAFHEQLDELLKAAMALLIWGGRVVIISTHNGEDNPFNELIKDIRSGRKPYSLHRVTFDDAIADGLYEQISKVSKKPLPPKDEWVAGVFADYGDSADEELRCIPARGGEAYFTQILMDGVMQTGIPVLRFRAPADNFVDWAKAQRDAVTDKWCRDNLDAPITACNKNFRHFAGVDAAGRTGDLATFWLLEELKNLELATMCVVEFEHLPYSEVERTLEYIFKAIPASVAFDATGNGQQLAERARQKYGASRVLEQKINDSYYTEAMPLAKRYIEDRTVTIPKDAGILSDFRQVKVMNGIPKFPAVKNVVSGTQRHGDAASAYVLAIWARQQLGDLGEPYYESLIKREKYFGKLAY